MTSKSSFDPCGVFPARVRGRRFTAEPIQPDGSGAGGATDLVKAKAYLPLANTAYARTVRLHEALHAIYSTKPSKERIKSGKGYTMLEQATEDARLHLNCARTEGSVRRDELATALQDLHKCTSKRGRGPDKQTAALIALRSAAILKSQDGPINVRHSNKLQELCDAVAPDYATAMHTALESIKRGEIGEASALLEPYFGSAGEAPMQRAFPLALAKEGKGEGPKLPTADFKFDKMEGKLTSDAADMLGGDTIKAITGATMPKLHIVPIFASSMIPTFFGESQKHVISGCKISAKKLATVVGPVAPKVFLKTIRRNGGTILIDASGSMNLSPEQLEKLVSKAPAATIAFYNSPQDRSPAGNLWIYAHKGKRALDFSLINFEPLRMSALGSVRGVDAARNVYGWGNVVDFQALQWLLAQESPRYVLTDGGFTGCYETEQAACELLKNAIARKKIMQVTSLKEMENLLEKGALTNGRTEAFFAD